jgi:hypothetical protein
MSVTLLQGKDKDFRDGKKFEKSINLQGASLKPGLSQVSLRLILIPTPFSDNQTHATDTQYGHGEEVHWTLTSLPEGVSQASVNSFLVPS